MGSLTLTLTFVFVFWSVFVSVSVFAFAGGVEAGGPFAGGALAGVEDEEVRYRLTSDTIVVVLVWLLCRGLSSAETESEGERERRGWVVRWVRTSWLVRVADCVSRICVRTVCQLDERYRVEVGFWR